MKSIIAMFVIVISLQITAKGLSKMSEEIEGQIDEDIEMEDVTTEVLMKIIIAYVLLKDDQKVINKRKEFERVVTYMQLTEKRITLKYLVALMGVILVRLVTVRKVVQWLINQV